MFFVRVLFNIEGDKSTSRPFDGHSGMLLYSHVSTSE